MHLAGSARAVGIVVGAAAGLTVLAVERPAGVVVHGPDPTAAVVGVCGWAAWALATYLLVAVLATAARHLPRCPSPLRTLAALSPRGLRMVVDTAVGVTAAAAVGLSPTGALASPPPSPASAAAPALPAPDWPGLHPRTTPITTATRPAAVPVPARTAAARPTASAAPSPPTSLRPATSATATGTAGGAEVVVRPGDSLWSLTARRLGPRATPAAVAATWPRLYAANRAVIGADPDLLHPGQHLLLPADDRTPP